MNRGEDTKDLDAFAEALTRLGPRNLTWPMLCERAEVDHSISDPLWRALGFRDVPPDEPAYTEDDLRALRIAVEGLKKLEGDARDQALEFIVRETRTVSGYLARIAETQVDALAELQRLGLRESVRAETLKNGVERSPLGWLIMYVLRRRLDEAIKRRGSTEVGAEPLLVVGFIDLVDFTRASTGLDAAEFGRVLGRFEALAWDEITEAGGRLIKLIGDEAMFVFPPTDSPAKAALRIVSQCGHDTLPQARAGLAAGPITLRGGDYFGPVVNLASRLVDTAQPGAVLVDETYHSLLEHQHPETAMHQREARHLKGVGTTKLWELEQSDTAASDKLDDLDDPEASRPGPPNGREQPRSPVSSATSAPAPERLAARERIAMSSATPEHCNPHQGGPHGIDFRSSHSEIRANRG